MKKIHRFLQTKPESIPNKITDPTIINQIQKVLKLKVGEECVFFYNQEQGRLVELTSITKESITYEPKSLEPLPDQPKHKLVIALSILKSDKFELAVQKIAEMGALEIWPIISDRTVKESVRLERIQKIADEATELSGGISRTIIKAPIQLKDALKQSQEKWLVCESGAKTKDQFPQMCVLAIGPEGGWTPNELKMFEEKNCDFLNLGPRMLRAETATIVATYKILWN